MGKDFVLKECESMFFIEWFVFNGILFCFLMYCESDNVFCMVNFIC